jgi:hypothetical protein
LLERQLDGLDLADDREPLLHNLRKAADRLRDDVHTLTELADTVFGGTDTIVRIESPPRMERLIRYALRQCRPGRRSHHAAPIASHVGGNDALRIPRTK